MYLFEVTFTATHYNRVQTDASGDTEFSHTSIEEYRWGCVIPEDTESYRAAALELLKTERYRSDPAFAITGSRIVCDVQALMHPLQRRL